MPSEKETLDKLIEAFVLARETGRKPVTTPQSPAPPKPTGK